MFIDQEWSVTLGKVWVVFVPMSWHAIPCSPQGVKMMSFWLIISWLVLTTTCSSERWGRLTPSSGEGRGGMEAKLATHGQWVCQSLLCDGPLVTNPKFPRRWLSHSLSPSGAALHLYPSVSSVPLTTTNEWAGSRVKEKRQLQVWPLLPRTECTPLEPYVGMGPTPVSFWRQLGSQQKLMHDQHLVSPLASSGQPPSVQWYSSVQLGWSSRNWESWRWFTLSFVQPHTQQLASWHSYSDISLHLTLTGLKVILGGKHVALFRGYAANYVRQPDFATYEGEGVLCLSLGRGHALWTVHESMSVSILCRCWLMGCGVTWYLYRLCQND